MSACFLCRGFPGRGCQDDKLAEQRNASGRYILRMISLMRPRDNFFFFKYTPGNVLSRITFPHSAGHLKDKILKHVGGTEDVCVWRVDWVEIGRSDACLRNSSLSSKPPDLFSAPFFSPSWSPPTPPHPTPQPSGSQNFPDVLVWAVSRSSWLILENRYVYGCGAYLVLLLVLVTLWCPDNGS